LIVVMLTIITYSIVFYFGHRFMEDSLDQFIVSDTFSKKHDWIDLETETRESGDLKVDGWVAHYKFIRIMFAMGVLPLIACVYLFWFA
jgi:low affinity Fe/Cu permease